MTLPKITVITPFYNSMRFIDTPMNAVLNQTYQNWEYICVDDCSTDGTLEKLREYAAKDPRVKVIARPVNGGSAAAGFNTGIAAASGDYIQLLGHDDELSPDCLEQIAARIAETGAEVVIPDAKIVSTEIDEKAENFTMTGVQEKGRKGDRGVVLSPREAFALSIDWKIHSWACYSADLVRRCPRLDEQLMNGDELWTRVLFLNANKVVFSKGCYVYLRRKGSISNNLNAKSFDVFRVERELLRLLRENRFDRKTVNVCKRDLISRVKMHTFRYLFGKSSMDAAQRDKARGFLTDGGKLAFRECWFKPEYWFTRLKVRQTARRYEKYLKLQKKLRKKGLVD